jgi:XisI protein
VDTLKQILLDTMTGYTGKGLNSSSYLTCDANGDLFATISIGNLQHQHIANSGLIVRLIGEFIVIEQDMNDKILLDALLQAGVPREKIVLAYAGEKLPEAEEVAG